MFVGAADVSCCLLLPLLMDWRLHRTRTILYRFKAEHLTEIVELGDIAYFIMVNLKENLILSIVIFVVAHPKYSSAVITGDLW